MADTKMGPQMKSDWHLLRFLSDSFYLWVFWILKEGNKITPVRLFALPEEYKAVRLLELIEARLKSGYSPFWALANAYWLRYLRSVPSLVVRIVLLLLQTHTLTLFLNALSSSDTSFETVLREGIYLVSYSAASIVFHHGYFSLVFYEAARWKAGIVALIFSKALRLDLASLSKVTPGFIVNLASNDVGRLTKLACHFPFLLLGPIEAGIAGWLLWQQLGVASLAGWLCLGILCAATGYASGRIGALRSKASLATDRRVQLASTIVSGLHVIKVHGWEVPFLNKLRVAREEEMTLLRKVALWRSLSSGCMTICPYITPACSFLALYYGGGVLTTESVFTSLVLYQFLQVELAYFASMALEGLAEGFVLMKRLCALLALPESQSPRLEWTEGAYVSAFQDALQEKRGSRKWEQSGISAKTRKLQVSPSSSASIDIENLSIAFEMRHVASTECNSTGKEEGGGARTIGEREAARKRLEIEVEIDTQSITPSPAIPAAKGSRHVLVEDLSASLEPHSLTVITGLVGCGKTTLLLAMLNELPSSSLQGSISISGKRQRGDALSADIDSSHSHGTQSPAPRIAYVPQAPWLFSGSVRENILLGLPYDAEHYTATLAAACLTEEVAALQKGDATPLHKQRLSGGQKMRIGLARALYAMAPIVLYDDPLASLDARVGAEVLRSCILQAPDGTGDGRESGAISSSPSSSSSSSSSLSSSSSSSSQALRVLVTHQTHVAPSADVHVELLTVDEENRVDGGAGGEIRKRAIVRNLTQGRKLHHGAESEQKLSSSSSSLPPPSIDSAPTLQSTTSSSSSPASAASSPPPPVLEDADSEDYHGGDVSAIVYWNYAKSAYGLPGIAIGVLLLLIHVSVNNSMSYVLALWTQLPPSAASPLALNATTSDAAAAAAASQLGLAGERLALAYLSLSIVAFFMSIITGMAFFLGLAKAADALHTAASSRVICATSLWLSKNNAGRILNRFSRDLGTLDDSLPFTLFEYGESAAAMLATVVLVVCVTPWLILAFIPLFFLVLRMRKTYLISSRALKRIESATRSPVYARLSDCLDGLPVLRAYGAGGAFLSSFFDALDNNTRAVYNGLALSRWMGFYLDCICVALLGAAVAVAISMRGNATAAAAANSDSASSSSSATISPSMLGLVLSQVMGILGNFQWTVRQSAEAESEMISTERLLEYAEKVPIEAVDAAAEMLQHQQRPPPPPPSPDWPAKGTVAVRGVRLRYEPHLPFVLKGINAECPAGSRVAFLGRTGSGKSTLLASILRLYEPEEPKMGGEIEEEDVDWLSSSTSTADNREAGGGHLCGISIDGVDIGQVGLTRLRSTIGVIPQEPLLFAGTLRFNLDPFSEHSDAAVWGALRRVRLEAWAQRRGGLGGLLSDGGGIGSGGGGGASGSNPTENTQQQQQQQQQQSQHASEAGASMGERQSICLARALLRRNRILLTDEATANVDEATDYAINEAIRESFSDGTVIIVAHRIKTVMDCTCIFLLEGGRVVEEGSPRDLLHREGEGARFAALVSAMGEQGAAEVHALLKPPCGCSKFQCK